MDDIKSTDDAKDEGGHESLFNNNSLGECKCICKMHKRMQMQMQSSLNASGRLLRLASFRKGELPAKKTSHYPVSYAVWYVSPYLQYQPTSNIPFSIRAGSNHSNTAASVFVVRTKWLSHVTSM